MYYTISKDGLKSVWHLWFASLHLSHIDNLLHLDMWGIHVAYKPDFRHHSDWNLNLKHEHIILLHLPKSDYPGCHGNIKPESSGEITLVFMTSHQLLLQTTFLITWLPRTFPLNSIKEDLINHCSLCKVNSVQNQNEPCHELMVLSILRKFILHWSHMR